MTLSVKILADSVNTQGHRLTTFEVEYWRAIHAEIMTHRMLSRNFSSSRAIPVTKMLDQVIFRPETPTHWGKNQAGMQAKEELADDLKQEALREWMMAAQHAAQHASKLSDIGLHKQATNRILEPYQTMKGVISATEWTNFLWLRNHEDAQPEIKALAELIQEALDNSTPVTLYAGDWHVPYYKDGYWYEGDKSTSLEDAIMISTSCCAQVSYRKLDQSIEKARDLHHKLLGGDRKHSSAFEHVATPFDRDDELADTVGATAIDKEGVLWSGNFRGWKQYRQTIDGHVKW